MVIPPVPQPPIHEIPGFELPSGAHPVRRKPVRGLGLWVFVELLAANRWPKHWHDYWELTFLFGSAVCDVSCRGLAGRLHLCGGEFWIIPPNLVHSVQWREKSDAISLYIDPVRMEQVVKAKRDVAVGTLMPYVSAQPMIAEQCADLLKFGTMPNGRTDWDVACAGSHLAATFLATHRLIENGAVTRLAGLNGAIVESVKRFVAEQPRERLPVGQLACDVGTSPRNFRRIFRMLMGESPQQWALVQKARRAKELLKSGHSIKETVAKGAFSDSRHLNRVLRAVFHVSARTLQPHVIHARKC